VVQKYALPNQSVLHRYLFGSVATLLRADLISMGVIAIVVVLSVYLLRKECVIASFDQDYARVLGYPVTYIDGIIYILLTLAISSGLHMTGVILMSTMIIAPAAAARQWTSCIQKMMWLSSFFGSCTAIIGIIVSSMFLHTPTGPCMVVTASIIVIFSMLFAPHRGLCKSWMRT
jgi:manganese/zinc/iron transport system permease protein